MNTTTTEIHHQLVELTAERDHWKANHDNRVNAAKILMDRTDMPLERVGAYKHYVAALEANQKLRELAEKAEAELAKLRVQEPVTFVFDPNGYAIDGKHTEIADALPIGMDLYAAPIPALAVLAPPTPFIPDDDTRRNDESFAAQQAATAPSVPDEWRAGLSRLLDTFERCEAGFPPHVELRFAVRDKARALLQSANHSERNLEMVAPDCLTCANLGRVNGLSQESYCDSCIYQGRDWRKNHFVDARKMADAVNRRCEACAILPCSCK